MKKVASIAIAALVLLVATAAAAVWLFMLPRGNVLLVDGDPSAAWVVEGDSEVKDGVLILGGNNRTWARTAVDLSPDFELHLQYRAENSKNIQFETHHWHFWGHGKTGVTLQGPFNDPGKWIEAVFWGQELAAGKGWMVRTKWRAVGDDAFNQQQLGGLSSEPGGSFIAFEIPAGQKLYLRNVLVNSGSGSFPWILVFIAGALVVVLVIAVAAWAFVNKRRAPSRRNVPVLPTQTETP